MSAGDPISDPSAELIEAYCDGLISDEDLRRLEACLFEDENARRAFVTAFHLHTELHFAIRARRAADAAVQRVLASDPSEQLKKPGLSPARRWRIPIGKPPPRDGLHCSRIAGCRLGRGDHEFPSTNQARRVGFEEVHRRSPWHQRGVAGQCPGLPVGRDP